MEEKQIKRTCKECKQEFVFNSRDEITQKFYKKKTHTGIYFLKTCIPCELKKHSEKWFSGKYKNSKVQQDYAPELTMDTKSDGAE